MPINEVGLVRTIGQGLTSGANTVHSMDPSGATVVMDFYLKSMLDGHGFQVRAGTITTPLVGDVAITDTFAEYCVDGGTNLVIIPVYNNISVRAGSGTAHEMAIKSVATVSSAGTAFTPLPLMNTGVAASTTARVSAAGGVTVTAELATTTMRHWSYSQQAVFTTGQVIIPDYSPRTPPVLVGSRCLYVQIAAATTGPSFYASIDYLEFTRAQMGL